MTVAELKAFAPGFDWDAWLEGAKLGGVRRFIIGEKSAFPKLAKVYAETPLASLW